MTKRCNNKLDDSLVKKKELVPRTGEIQKSILELNNIMLQFFFKK